MRRVLLIGTGGTIASRSHLGGGLEPQMSCEEMLAFVPCVHDVAVVDTCDLLSIDSTNMQPAHWLAIARRIEDSYDDYDGFVVCHGTDTMSFTSSALSYLVQDSPKPIVLTGAQRPIDLDVTDARTNLTDAIRLAAHERAHDVCIVMGGNVICGTRARKVRTHSYNAFISINHPYLATIQGERVVFYLDDHPVDKSARPRFSHEMNGNVGLLKLTPPVSAEILDVMCKTYDALVIESFGVGGLPSYHNEPLGDILRRHMRAGTLIAMTTQVPLEGSDFSVYEVGRSVPREDALLEARDMTLEACLTKLMWVLGQTREVSQARELFYEPHNRDTLWA